ncbi:ribosomal-protein-alanine N-acetyltransferase [Aliikangiella marina]|uniref:[Ribosomal protein bS18]-alanine N-acetyltransferase n=1 Tax=Aliikangiella marina TaxID=1712262 RepID=A0A545T2M5_9GAMM|nr:ribosomal protein S18-alanine N-acetyltransferase [Aliikangiella marina]TQV71458.1 ribosomal-protein-alanine N-acetyltransferase [Aliikangiella marina]
MSRHFQFKAASEEEATLIIEIELAVHLKPWSPAQVSAGISRYLAWSIYEQKVLAGYMFVLPLADDWELINIAIAKAYQQQGVAKKALAFLKAQAMTQGVGRVLLEVRESNLAALKLYQSAGFSIDGRRKNYYRSNKQTEDAILMSCVLS